MKSNQDSKVLNIIEVKNDCKEIQVQLAEVFNTLKELNFDLDNKDEDSSQSIRESIINTSNKFDIIEDCGIEQYEYDILFTQEEKLQLQKSIVSTLSILHNSLTISSKLLNEMKNGNYGESALDRASYLIQVDSVFSIPFFDSNNFKKSGITQKTLPLKFLNSANIKSQPIIRSFFLISESKKKNNHTIDSKETGRLKEIINISESNLENIKRRYEEISIFNSEAKDKFDSFYKLSGRIDSISKEIIKKSESASDIIESINDSMIKIESDRARAELLSEEVRKDRDLINDEIKSTSESIKKINDATINANTASEKLNTLHERASEILRRSEEILTNTGSSALGGNFNEQYNIAKKFIYIWPFFGLISLLSAICICINAINNHATDGESVILIARLAISPIALIGVWFSGNQYIKQKQIIEDYAYKKTIALSLISFKNEIKNAETTHERDYILEALKELHKSPLDSLEKKNIKNEIEAIEKMRVDILKSVIDKFSSSEKDKKTKKTKKLEKK